MMNADILANLQRIKEEFMARPTFDPPKPVVFYVSPGRYAWLQEEAAKVGMTPEEYVADMMGKEIFAGLEVARANRLAEEEDQAQ